LTSGQQPTAIEGADLIARLIPQADDRIVIMPGSGIRSGNITELAQKTKAEEFHSSARTFLQSTMHYVNADMKEDDSVVIADENDIKKMVALLAS
jgi:copper homeostasis protein